MQFVIDAHCHTIASGHAYSTVKENVDMARERGLKLIAITDHAPSMTGGPTGFYFFNLPAIPKIIDGVEVLKGVELNILDESGSVDLSMELLKLLDIVIASLHPPCYKPSSFEEHTSAIIGVMNNPYVNIIGHLGDPRYLFDIDKVIKVAKETNIIIELNNASFNPSSTRAGGGDIVRDIIKSCILNEVPMLLASDAHFHTSVGDFSYIMPLIDEMQIPEHLLLNYSTERLKEILNKKRGTVNGN